MEEPGACPARGTGTGDRQCSCWSGGPSGVEEGDSWPAPQSLVVLCGCRATITAGWRRGRVWPGWKGGGDFLNRDRMEIEGVRLQLMGAPVPARPSRAAAAPPPTSDHALRPLTLAQPLCVPLHTLARAAGHLGAIGPRCHVLGRPVQQQRIVVQSSWAGVAVGTQGTGCRWPARLCSSQPQCSSPTTSTTRAP